MNLSHFTVKTLEDVEQIRTTVAQCLSPLDKKVYAIVNYDGFRMDPDLIDPYFDMVKWLTDHFYSGVTRYTTSGFLRMKLGELLQKRGVAPHIYEGAEEAREHLRELGESSPSDLEWAHTRRSVAYSAEFMISPAGYRLQPGNSNCMEG